MGSIQLADTRHLHPHVSSSVRQDIYTNVRIKQAECTADPMLAMECTAPHACHQNAIRMPSECTRQRWVQQQTTERCSSKHGNGANPAVWPQVAKTLSAILNKKLADVKGAAGGGRGSSDHSEARSSQGDAAEAGGAKLLAAGDRSCSLPTPRKPSQAKGDDMV